jgi:hypothetical protein
MALGDITFCYEDVVPRRMAQYVMLHDLHAAEIASWTQPVPACTICWLALKKAFPHNTAPWISQGLWHISSTFFGKKEENFLPVSVLTGIRHKDALHALCAR